MLRTFQMSLVKKCFSLYTVYFHAHIGHDCRDIKDRSAGNLSDGVYTIRLKSEKEVTVFCDMTNGGWTVRKVV